jgi:hypothetical protein
MKLHPSPWDFKGIPSQIGDSLGRTQTPRKAPAPSLIFTAKQLHPLRKSEASKVGSTSRNPTANISKGGRA